SVADEFLGFDAELALAAFLVRGAGAKDDRPVGPGAVGGALFGAGELADVRGRGEQFELRQAGAALAVRGAGAVAAGIAAADDDDVLAGGQDLVFERVALV